MDTLSEFLADVHIEASSLSIFELGRPWGLIMGGPAFLFVVAEGECLLKQGNGASIRLRPGDSVLALRGDAVVLASDESAKLVGIEDIWRANSLPVLESTGGGHPYPLNVKWGGPGQRTRILGLAVTLPKCGLSSTLVRALAPVVVQTNEQTHLLTWIAQVIGFLSEEQNALKAGYIATAAALAQFVLVSLLRSFSLSAEARSIPWFNDDSVSGVARALQLMRTRPEHPWTVAELAAKAGMSRTVFAQRFAMATGCTPIDYLKSCRMRLAAQHVLAAKTPIAELASEFGYQSERAFRQVFKREHGLSPTAYRKRANRLYTAVTARGRNLPAGMVLVGDLANTAGGDMSL